MINLQKNNKARHISLIMLLNLLFLLVSTACQKPDPAPTPVPQQNTAAERTVVYTVGDTENRSTLATEAEWDALLDQLCERALDGSEVAFYSTGSYIAPATKEPTTITTADREELKRWMKAMEKQGLTVQINYDDGTGTWRGNAYATAPTENTSETLTGTWRFNCMVVTRYDLDGQLLGSDLFALEENGGTWYYTFSDDGTLTITIYGMEGTTTTESSTWSLSDDGVLYSDLLPSGTYWNFNWITSNTMIISSAAIGTTEGDIYYQLQFDRQ